jgi:hypothetical protein
MREYAGNILPDRRLAMHFRIRKNVVQLIRTKYDESKKKGNSAVIGTVKLARPELSDDLRRDLSPQEAAEFAAWVETQYRANALREELAALTLGATLAEAEKWFERQGNSPAARRMASEILFQWQTLRGRFAKNGLLD